MGQKKRLKYFNCRTYYISVSKSDSEGTDLLTVFATVLQISITIANTIGLLSYLAWATIDYIVLR